MQRTPGQLSPDSAWFWDGQEWRTTLSPDGAWRWNGSQWAPTGLGLARQPAPASRRPGVYRWFVVYAVVMAVIYALALTIGAVAASGALHDSSIPDTDLQIEGIAYVVVSVPLLALYAAAPLLPRRSWVWTYDLVLIAIGFLGLSIVAAIPLLIFWVRPEARAYFGRG